MVAVVSDGEVLELERQSGVGGKIVDETVAVA